MAIIETLLQELEQEAQTTRRVLERVPDTALGWKPHEKSMSLGGLATHLSTIAVWGGSILNEPFFDLASAPPNQAEKTSRAEILAAFDETRKRTRGWMDKSDAEYASMWSLRRGGQELEEERRQRQVEQEEAEARQPVRGHQAEPGSEEPGGGEPEDRQDDRQDRHHDRRSVGPFGQGGR